MRASTPILPTVNNTGHRSKNTAMAVVGGGLVVTATALTALGIVGGIGAFRNSTSNQNADGEKHVEDNVAKEFVRTGLLLPLPPTISPVQRPSVFPSRSSVPSLNPSSSFSSRPTSYPSSIPTATGRPTLMPSDSPSITSKPTSGPSSFPSATPSDAVTEVPSSSPPTSYPIISPTKSPSQAPSQAPAIEPTKLLKRNKLDPLVGQFSLRLHWEPHALWQGKTHEMYFCMACAWCSVTRFRDHCDIKNTCEEGMELALINCEPNKGKNPRRRKKLSTTFTLLETDNGGGTGLFADYAPSKKFTGSQIQVVDTNRDPAINNGTALCLERKRKRDIVLTPCDASVERQRFTGFNATGQGMEIDPEGIFSKRGVTYERCLTQHHHPRQGERVYAEKCRKARNSKTNKWSTY